MVMETANKIKCPDLSKEMKQLLLTIPDYPQVASDLDYALLPTGELIRLHCSDYRDPNKKRYPDAIPIIWEEWLYGPPGDGASTLSIGEAIVVAATGLKGSGKSETLAYLSAKALALDMPVWSNMGVKFWLAHDGELTYCATRELDWSAVLLLTKDLEHGAMVIDELSYYASSRLSSSVRNRILNAAVNQVRKRMLDFYSSVKFLRQIDVNIREELDCQIACEDLARSAGGQKLGLDKGCFVRWKAQDISGWSGYTQGAIKGEKLDRLGEPIYAGKGSTRVAFFRFTWPIYNSYEVVETADAFRKVRLDLEETVITDKQQQSEVEGLLAMVIDQYKEDGNSTVVCDDFRQAATSIGIRLNDKQLGKVLRNSFGIERKRRNKANIYLLDENE